MCTFINPLDLCILICQPVDFLQNREKKAHTAVRPIQPEASFISIHHILSLLAAQKTTSVLHWPDFTTCTLTMAPTSLPADKEYGEIFLDACESGNISQIHDAIASGRLTPYYRNEGLVLSVARGIQPGYVEVVAALLAAGASIMPWVRNAVHGEDMQQDPAVIRLLLDHGLDPNATQSADFEPPDSMTQTGGEPLLRYVGVKISPPSGISVGKYSMSKADTY